MSTPKISAQAVKELRDRTGSPMMDCKRALEESGGDQSAALDFLRKKGMATAAKKESRRSADGLVAVHVTADGKRGALIELNSETDFVAKNPVFQRLALDIAALRVGAGAEVDVEKFKADFELASGPKSAGAVAVGEAVKEMVATVGENCQLRKAGVVEIKEGIISKYIHTPMGTDVGKLGVLVALETSSTDAEKLADVGTKLAMHVAASSPLFLNVADVSKEAEEKEKSIFMAQAAESGKKPEHAAKMVTGRIRKWHQEVALMEQEFLISGDSDKKRSVGKFLEETGRELGAPIACSGFLRFKCGESE
jgi:elongation factor Ts